MSLWFISRDRRGNAQHRRRTGEVLFIDARKLGTMINRRLRELSDDDIEQISGAYHAWRNHDGGYEDVPGFAKVATLAEIETHGFVLTPGSYVGTEEVADDDEPISEKIARLTTELYAEFDLGRALEATVRERLEGIHADQ